MVKTILIAFFQFITLAAAFGSGKKAETDGGVLVLDDNNFQKETFMAPWMLVEFYATWWYVKFPAFFINVHIL